VWSIPGPIEIRWKVKNIDTTKSIRFFLINNEMVVQELGSFKNSGSIKDIVLASNIDSGSGYQVVGIELFPDDKFSVAKFITPLFTIINSASDDRKRSAVDMNGAYNTQKNNTSTSFMGRKIAYKKELLLNSKNLCLTIWDHGRQDGDVVSIYLNDKAIISKHTLTYRKKKIEISLEDSGSNSLLLYAHNLGTAPPNTVSLEISDGETSENIILNSDLQSSEAVMIRIKD